MTLVEITVAVFILSVVLVSLGALMSQVSVRTRQAAALSYLSAAAAAAEARAEKLPWDSLGPGSSVIGCTTDTSGQLVYSRCTTITGHPVFDTVRVVLTPTGTLTAPPETVVVFRGKPGGEVPFVP